jgi:hypothetical protein
MNDIKTNYILENWLLIDKVLINENNYNHIFKSKQNKKDYLELKSILLLNLKEIYDLLKVNKKVDKYSKKTLNEKVELIHYAFSKELKESGVYSEVNLLDSCLLFRKDIANKLVNFDFNRKEKYKTMIETHRKIRNDLVNLTKNV